MVDPTVIGTGDEADGGLLPRWLDRGVREVEA